jgi:hypothetical protein
VTWFIFGSLFIVVFLWQVICPRHFLSLWGGFLTVAWTAFWIVVWMVLEWASGMDAMNAADRPHRWAAWLVLPRLASGLLIIWTPWTVRAVLDRHERRERSRRAIEAWHVPQVRVRYAGNT